MPRVTRLVWDRDIAEKIERKHRLTTREVDEACFNPGRLVLKGPRRWRKKRYLVYSQTDVGRYILVVLEPLVRGGARVITARDLKENEKRFYKERRERR
ncbi:MAG: BrnT family toxin [Candidatus Bipolaricaulia bacterium]